MFISSTLFSSITPLPVFFAKSLAKHGFIAVFWYLAISTAFAQSILDEHTLPLACSLFIPVRIALMFLNNKIKMVAIFITLASFFYAMQNMYSKHLTICWNRTYLVTIKIFYSSNFIFVLNNIAKIASSVPLYFPSICFCITFQVFWIKWYNLWEIFLVLVHSQFVGLFPGFCLSFLALFLFSPYKVFCSFFLRKQKLLLQ